MGLTIAVDPVQARVTELIAEVAREPGFSRHGDAFPMPFHVDADGTPAVRVSIANASPDTDIWEGLRSPAAAGLHPLGLRDIWDFYAANTVRSVRPDGSPNYLAIPERFDEARERYRRAVILSVLLPLSHDVVGAYADALESGCVGTHEAYCRAAGDVLGIVQKASEKLCLSLLAPGRAVVSMTPAGAGKVEDFTRSASRRGKYHGPCNSAFPQSSVAVLTGLMQYGVCRLPMRDERDSSGRVVRMMGNCCAIVVFDDTPPVADGEGGVVLLDRARLERSRRLADFTVVDADAVGERFCPYSGVSTSDAPTCNACVRACPSGAVPNSVPQPNGEYPERVLKQKHRFHGNFLKFDFGNCSKERGQKSTLYSEYACARCLVTCASCGLSSLGDRC